MSFGHFDPCAVHRHLLGHAILLAGGGHLLPLALGGLCGAHVFIHRGRQNGPAFYGQGAHPRRLSPLHAPAHSEDLSPLCAVGGDLLCLFPAHRLRPWGGAGILLLSAPGQPLFALLLHRHRHAVLSSHALLAVDGEAYPGVPGPGGKSADLLFHAAVFLHPVPGRHRFSLF